MNKKDFDNEKMYRITMALVNEFVKQGIISDEEYAEIDTIFLEKYRPILGSLFSKSAC